MAPVLPQARGALVHCRLHGHWPGQCRL